MPFDPIPYTVPAVAPEPAWWPPPKPRVPWIVNIQCRDASISANTRCSPPGCLTIIPTCHIIASTRNGVPCRCCCPPGLCRGKLGTFYR